MDINQAQKQYDNELPDDDYDPEEVECRYCGEIYEVEDDDFNWCPDCELKMDYDSREGY